MRNEWRNVNEVSGIGMCLLAEPSKLILRWHFVMSEGIYEAFTPRTGRCFRFVESTFDRSSVSIFTIATCWNRNENLLL